MEEQLYIELLSFSSLFATSLALTALIGILYLAIKRTTILSKCGVVSTYCYVIFTIVRGLLPFDLSYFHLAKNYYSTEVLPAVQDFMKHPVTLVSTGDIVVFEILLTIWILVACIFLIRRLLGFLKCARLIEKLPTVVSNHILNSYQKAKLVVFPMKNQEYKIVTARSLSSPAVFGIIHPIILLPDF